MSERKIDGKTKMLCVIGDPIEHTKSPAMHNAALRELGLDSEFVYVALRVPKGELEKTVRGMKALGIVGMNVTIPHKIEIMRYLDEVDPLAREIGAVNTIVNRGGKLIGYNTDGRGALDALRARTELAGRKVLMIGAGGAARAIAFTLAEEGGIAELVILNRTGEKAVELAEAVSKRTGIIIRGRQLNVATLPEEIGRADVLVNCASTGMSPESEQSLVPKELLRKGLVVFDVVYNPLMTRLLRDAKEAGCRVITGETMLVNQGARAFEMWTGKKPNTAIMRDAVLVGVQMPAATGERKSIALIGFMGTGKTTVGRVVAEKMGMEFIEMDSLIERMTGKPVPRIFEQDGEPRFRELEVEVTRQVSAQNGVIVSCGGGVALNKINVDCLKRGGALLVLLTASPETICRRLENDGERPLLKVADPMARIRELLSAREPFYEQAADVAIDTTGLGADDVAAKIVEIAKEEGIV